MIPQATTPTVHICDDDLSLCNALENLIESIGLPARCYNSAQEFLSSYDGHSPGCLLLDVRMPGMSGLNLLDALAQQNVEMPAVVMSAFADVPMAVSALHKGAVYFIEKPFREQVLLDAVHSAIEIDAERRRRRDHRNEILGRIKRLTPREHQVMDLVVSGAHNKDIAEQMGISVKSIEANRARIMRKMEAKSFAALIRMAMALENGPPPATPPGALGVPPRPRKPQATISATSSR